MMAPLGEAPVLEITNAVKNYQALRPLRIRQLAIPRGERVAVAGFDAGAAEMLVNLVTGASVPDEGEIKVLGQNTAAIAGADEWLASLDRFGIVSERAVMLEGSTVEQNLAMPFTLEIEPIPADVRGRVEALAAECGIEKPWLEEPAADVPPDVRGRAHLARAVALSPALLLIEHPTARIAERSRAAFARDVARVCGARQLTALIVTQDQEFASIVAHRTLRLNPATGELTAVRRRWWRLS
jgi:phospholipid/cholesterol/gamma-HCH transport system ATP-binding protein